MTLDEFFSGREGSRRIFEILNSAIDALGPVEIRLPKSQVAFRRSKAFAWRGYRTCIVVRFLGSG
jgi:hypothetical protein